MLAAAAQIVLVDGLAALSFDEVARRSGVAKTTIYRHFPSRHELLSAAIDAATPVPEVPDTGCLRGDLVAFLGNVLPIFADATLRAASFDLFAAFIREPELREVHRMVTAVRLSSLRAIYDRAVERGEIPAALGFQEAFEVIEGPFVVRSILWPESLADVDIEALVDRIVAMLNV